MDRELLDAEMIAGHLVPPGSVFAFLAEHRSELFPDSFTADLFPSRTGRPSLPADLVGSVLVLKELYDLSDPQTADALKYDIRWKVACGRSLTQVSFDASTLVYWRKRIAKSDRPDRVFDAVAEVIAQTGILRGRRKRCVDSTVFDDAVATQDTVTQLVAAMRKVARVVPGAADVITAVCRLDYSKPGKPPIDWDDPDAKAALVSALVDDALAVLAGLTGPDSPGRDAAEADALGLLALVAGQDVEPAEDSDGTDGRWRIARKVAPDRVISTVDREARHTRKSKSKRRDGFRGHLAAEPETGLITDCEMTMATGPGGSDAENGVKMACRDRFHGSAEGGDDAASAGEGTGAVPGAPQPEEPDDQEREDGLEMYGDSAYGSGEARAAYQAAGHDTVIKPKPVPAGRARRVHPGRLHHPRAGWHGHLPGRAYPADERQADCHLRRAVRRLPAAGAVHHRQRRPVYDHPPAGGAAARRPRAGPYAGVQAGLPDPVDDRTGHRLDRYPERPPHRAPLHRHREEQRLAARPVRRHQPADPGEGRADPRRRGLGPGLTGPPAHSGPPAARAGSPPGGECPKSGGGLHYPPSRKPEHAMTSQDACQAGSRDQRCSEAS